MISSKGLLGDAIFLIENITDINKVTWAHSVLFVILTLLFFCVFYVFILSYSESLLYGLPPAPAYACCAAWGILIGFGICSLVAWLHPNYILEYLVCYSIGLLVAVPNNLISESNISDEVADRHVWIKWVSFLSYLSMVVFLLRPH